MLVHCLLALALFQLIFRCGASQKGHIDSYGLFAKGFYQLLFE